MGFPRGDTWAVDFHLSSQDGVPIDITGKSFRMHGREKTNGPIVVDFTTYLSMVDEPSGHWRLQIPLDITSQYDWRNLIYDMEMTGVSPSSRETLFDGKIHNEPDVTHD